MQKFEIPIWEKQNLTVEEAAVYSNIGENKLRALIQNRNCEFVLHVGNKSLIKRKQFDDFISRMHDL